MAIVAACLAFGLVAAPSALAANHHSAKANAAAKKRVTARTVNARVTKTNKNLVKLS